LVYFAYFHLGMPYKVFWGEIQQQANSQKGAYGYSAITTNVGAPTRNLQYIKHKHADQM